MEMSLGAVEGRWGGRRRRNPGGPRRTQEDPEGGVSSGLEETTLCDVILIPLSEAVQSGLLPPGPPSPPGWLLRRPLPIG